MSITSASSARNNVMMPVAKSMPKRLITTKKTTAKVTTTKKLTTTKNGYVRLDLPIGNHTVVCSFTNKNKGYTTDKLTTWVNVIK